MRSVAGPILGILLGLAIPALPALSKTPGEVHCYHLSCHRVLTIAETEGLVGGSRILVASFYDDPHVDPSNAGGLTSSGEKFDADNSSRVGSSIYPDGTELLLWNPLNGRAVLVRIKDFGPFRSNRPLDLRKGVAKQLDINRQGVNALVVTVIAPPPSGEPTYRSFHTSSKIKGYVGIYDEEALAALAKKLTAESENRELVGPRDTIRTANHLVGTLFDVTPRASLQSLPPMETTVLVTPPVIDAIDVQPALVVAFDPTAYGPAPEVRTERLKFASYLALCLITAWMGIIFLQRLSPGMVMSANRTRSSLEHRLHAPAELARTPPREALSAVEPPAWSSIIGPELQISGCLKTSHDVTIEGSLDGDCVCRHLVIKPTGRLTGDVVAEDVLVDGSIKGRLLAKTVSLASRAVVIGDISYCDLIVERNATSRCDGSQDFARGLVDHQGG